MKKDSPKKSKEVINSNSIKEKIRKEINKIDTKDDTYSNNALELSSDDSQNTINLKDDEAEQQKKKINEDSSSSEFKSTNKN